MTAPGPDDADELVGAQAERTELAWVRTTLACAALAVTAGRLAGPGIGLTAALALGVLVAGPGLVASWWRLRSLRVRPEPAPPRVAGVAMLAGSIVVVDALVLVRLVM